MIFMIFFIINMTNLSLVLLKILYIQEELTFGRTTKISVNVEGEVIDEFIARPDEDFLEYMAESSASKVFKYFKKLEKQEKSIFQY